MPGGRGVAAVAEVVLVRKRAVEVEHTRLVAVVEAGLIRRAARVFAPESRVGIGHREDPLAPRLREEILKVTFCTKGGVGRQVIGVLFVESSVEVLREMEDRRRGQFRKLVRELRAIAEVPDQHRLLEFREHIGRHLVRQRPAETVGLRIRLQRVRGGVADRNPRHRGLPRLVGGDVCAEAAFAEAALRVAAPVELPGHKEGRRIG